MLPEAVFIEAKFFGKRGVVTELPFSGDTRGVSGVLEEMGEGGAGGVQFAEAVVVSDIVLPGHELGPGRRAERLGISAIEAHASGGEAVEIRCAVGSPATGADTLVAKIVGEDEDDIGFRGRGRGGRVERSEE